LHGNGFGGAGPFRKSEIDKVLGIDSILDALVRLRWGACQDIPAGPGQLLDGGFESLLQVRYDVLGRFDSDGEADQFIRDSHPPTLLGQKT
jgi:hypothetical protein